MTSRNICLLIALGFFLTFTFTGQPTDAQRSDKFQIHVGVTCDDEHTKSLIQSWTKRELRNLGDVAIVSFDNAHAILSIIAIESTYRATGRKTGGIYIGTIFVKRLSFDTESYHYPDFWINTWNKENLEPLCKEIVASVDTAHLEPARGLFH